MIICEGRTRDIARLAVIAVAGLATVAPDVPAATAGDWRPIESGGTSGLIVPTREILPWRRSIEERADRALEAAQTALRRGRPAEGVRRLAEIVREFPATHAGRMARAELEQRQQAKAWAGSLRQGLGLSGDVGSKDGEAIAISPVAGWQTVVRGGAFDDLRDSLIEAAGDRVFFEEGSSKLGAAARRVLAEQARWLRAHPNVEFKLVGHADDEGSGDSNLRLSHDRAVAVRRELMRQGVSGNRLHVVSIGDAQPIAICSVRTCAAQNRRVVSEIRLKRQAFGMSR